MSNALKGKAKALGAHHRLGALSTPCLSTGIREQQETGQEDVGLFGMARFRVDMRADQTQ